MFQLDQNKMAAVFDQRNCRPDQLAGSNLLQPVDSFIQSRSNSNLSGSCNMSAILDHLIGQTLTDNNWRPVIYLRDIQNKWNRFQWWIFIPWRWWPLKVTSKPIHVCSKVKCFDSFQMSKRPLWSKLFSESVSLPGQRDLRGQSGSHQGRCLVEGHFCLFCRDNFWVSRNAEPMLVWSLAVAAQDRRHVERHIWF